MGLSEDIFALLRDEGYPINEAIEDAVNDFVQIIEDEAESIAEELEKQEEQ